MRKRMPSGRKVGLVTELSLYYVVSWFFVCFEWVNRIIRNVNVDQVNLNRIETIASLSKLSRWFQALVINCGKILWTWCPILSCDQNNGYVGRKYILPPIRALISYKYQLKRLFRLKYSLFSQNFDLLIVKVLDIPDADSSAVKMLAKHWQLLIPSWSPRPT